MWFHNLFEPYITHINANTGIPIEQQNSAWWIRTFNWHQIPHFPIKQISDCFISAFLCLHLLSNIMGYYITFSLHMYDNYPAPLVCWLAASPGTAATQVQSTGWDTCSSDSCLKSRSTPAIIVRKWLQQVSKHALKKEKQKQKTTTTIALQQQTPTWCIMTCKWKNYRTFSTKRKKCRSCFMLAEHCNGLLHHSRYNTYANKRNLTSATDSSMNTQIIPPAAYIRLYAKMNFA